MTNDTTDALRAAFEAGFERALLGVWYADAVREYEPSMFDDWLASRSE